MRDHRPRPRVEKRQLALAAMPPLADTCWVFNRDNDAGFEREMRERGMI